MKTATGNSRQLAQSASVIGAAILGFGLGAKWGSVIQAFAVVQIVIGAIIHTYGMYVTQMKGSNEKSGRVAKILWVSAWVCLIALIGIFIYLWMIKS